MEPSSGFGAFSIAVVIRILFMNEAAASLLDNFELMILNNFFYRDRAARAERSGEPPPVRPFEKDC